MMPYVGLQLVNTGQSAAHIIMLPVTHSFWLAFQRSLFELSENQSFVLMFFQRLGKRVIIQNNTIIVQEIYFKKPVPIHESMVVACTIIVTIIIETESDAIIMYGLDLLAAFPALAQRITGKSGRTQGASMVSIPAKKETIINVIIVKLLGKKKIHLLSLMKNENENKYIFYFWKLVK